MHEVIFHRFASREYREARDWYRARSEQTSLRFRNAVAQAVNRIAADPIAPPKLISHYQYVRVHRFPYLLVFEQRPDDSVLIVAVAHTSRRPGYWRRRR
jgi:plasmid stabilization system protein ParE